MGLAKDAGLEDLVDETILDNLADYQTTRGIRGNYQNALITQKREWQDRTEKEKRGMLSKFFRNKSEEESIKESLGEVY